MRIVYPEIEQRKKAVSPARLRWLAKRRCLRALRLMLGFMVLFTPFSYFGYLLCCRMPLGLNVIFPDWIFLCEILLFIYNSKIFYRYVLKTPVLASLPIILNLLFILLYPPGPHYDINTGLYFKTFLDSRMQVVHMLQAGKFRTSDAAYGTINLPEPYSHLAMYDGLVIYKISENGICVIFSAGWGYLLQDDGYCYISDGYLSDWIQMGRIVDVEKIAPHWFQITAAFDYLTAITELPLEKTKQAPPLTQYNRSLSKQRIHFYYSK